MLYKLILVLSMLSFILTGCSIIDRFTKSDSTPTPAPELVTPTAEAPYPPPNGYPPPLILETQDLTQPYPAPDQPINDDQFTPASSPVSPLDALPNEANMQRGKVFIETTEILVQESQPPSVIIHLKGALPTPCHFLRAEVSKPDSDKRIMVKLYSLVDPNLVCTQVIQPFDSQFSLGSFPPGNYTVWINGEKVTKFNL